MSSKNESSTSNKETYICQNPELSNIDGFKKFCSNRLKSWELLVVFIFIVSGLILSLSSINYVWPYYPESGREYLEFLFSSPWINYLFIVFLIGLILIKRHFRNLKANTKRIIFQYGLITFGLLLVNSLTAIGLQDESSATLWTWSLFIYGIGLIVLGLLGLFYSLVVSCS